MTENVPLSADIDLVLFITVDCLRWDFSEGYKDLYPPGVWYRHTPQATFTPASHASAFTSLNPPRTGVIDFGESLYRDNIITNTHSSVSYSSITKRKSFMPIPGLDNDVHKFPFTDLDEDDLGEEPNWQEQLDAVPTELLDNLNNYDFAFLHDWSVHASGMAYEGSDWAKVISPQASVEENREAYQHQIDYSLGAHEQMLKHLKEAGLYENTLFVIFGDHGQGIGIEPSKEYGHNGKANEGVGRTPLAFTSPQFDEKRIDVETNARSVDFVPTLLSIYDEAGIEYDDFDHDFEGVDLTSFDGELAGYTINATTRRSGLFDSVKTSDRIYFNMGVDDYYDTEVTGDPFGYYMKTIGEPDSKFGILKQMYKSVRSQSDKLIVSEQPDEELLESMGYL